MLSELKKRLSKLGELVSFQVLQDFPNLSPIEDPAKFLCGVAAQNSAQEPLASFQTVKDRFAEEDISQDGSLLSILSPEEAAVSGETMVVEGGCCNWLLLLN